jgi:cytoskeletal protein CcmA (bactofilin family)
MIPKLFKSVASTATRTGGSGSPVSIIGADVRIVGNIETQGEMQIDGQVDGDISCRVLVVGESGRITGEVRAETVRIHGHVTGRLDAASVIIAKSGRVTGDIAHDTIEIEAGAVTEGHFVHRGSAAALAEAPARKSNGASHPEPLPVAPAEAETAPPVLN